MSYLSLPALYFPATINCCLLLLHEAAAWPVGWGCRLGFAINVADWHPQATLFDVTKVILIFSAKHSESSQEEAATSAATTAEQQQVALQCTQQQGARGAGAVEGVRSQILAA